MLMTVDLKVHQRNNSEWTYNFLGNLSRESDVDMRPSKILFTHKGIHFFFRWTFYPIYFSLNLIAKYCNRRFASHGVDVEWKRNRRLKGYVNQKVSKDDWFEWHSYPSVTFQYPLSYILVDCMSELPHFSWLNDIVSSCSCLYCKNLKKRLLAESQCTIKIVWLYEQWESEAIAA